MTFDLGRLGHLLASIVCFALCAAMWIGEPERAPLAGFEPGTRGGAVVLAALVLASLVSAAALYRHARALLDGDGRRQG